ncbi:hypothetical protein ACFE04_000917 [Oxalis oulophora]
MFSLPQPQSASVVPPSQIYLSKLLQALNQVRSSNAQPQQQRRSVREAADTALAQKPPSVTSHHHHHHCNHYHYNQNQTLPIHTLNNNNNSNNNNNNENHNTRL